MTNDETLIEQAKKTTIELEFKIVETVVPGGRQARGQIKGDRSFAHNEARNWTNKHARPAKGGWRNDDGEIGPELLLKKYN